MQAGKKLSIKRLGLILLISTWVPIAIILWPIPTEETIYQLAEVIVDHYPESWQSLTPEKRSDALERHMDDIRGEWRFGWGIKLSIFILGIGSALIAFKKGTSVVLSLLIGAVYYLGWRIIGWRIFRWEEQKILLEFESGTLPMDAFYLSTYAKYLHPLIYCILAVALLLALIPWGKIFRRTELSARG